MCNTVQRIPEYRTLISIERPTREKTDPVLPRSAAIGLTSFQLETMRLRSTASIAARGFPLAVVEARAASGRWQL